MLKSLVLLGVICIVPAAEAADASGLPPPRPALLDCIRDDQVVCSYRIVDETELAHGGPLSIQPVVGLPAPDRIEVGRIDGDRIVVYIFYPSHGHLQGVAF